MNLPPYNPGWAYPAVLIAIGMLIIVGAIVMRRRKPEFDAHGEPYGDQPQVPL